MNKPKRKTVLKQITKWSKSLPLETYKAFHKYNEPRVELDEEGKKVLRVGYLEDHNKNHKRRMKRCYDLFGMDGIHAYLSLYNLQLTNKNQ